MFVSEPGIPNPSISLFVILNFENEIPAVALISPFVMLPSVICALPTVLNVAKLPNSKLARPVAAANPVAPPSHFNRSAYAVS